VPDYLPVTVEAARSVGICFHKDVVVILSIDRSHDLMHTTTWGRSAEDKVFAARWGDVLTAASGSDLTQRQTFEDFRTMERAALNAAAADRRRMLISDVLAFEARLPQDLVVRLKAEAGNK